MVWRAERQRDGFCQIWSRDGSSRNVRANEYEPLTAALQAGTEWYEAETLYGEPVMIRLATVAEVVLASAASVAAADADEADRRAHDIAGPAE